MIEGAFGTQGSVDQLIVVSGREIARAKLAALEIVGEEGCNRLALDPFGSGLAGAGACGQKGDPETKE